MDTRGGGGPGRGGRGGRGGMRGGSRGGMRGRGGLAGAGTAAFGSGSDHSENTALHLKGVPAHLNSTPLLAAHFSRFGTVTDIIPNPAKLSATVTFATHGEADNARVHGTIMENNKLGIFWHRPKTDAPPTGLSPFGAPTATTTAPVSVFNAPATSPPSGSIFAQGSTAASGGSIFAQGTTASGGSSIFSKPAGGSIFNQASTGSLFDQPSTTGGSVFGSKPAATGGSIFSQPAAASSSIYAQPARQPLQQNHHQQQQQRGSSIFAHSSNPSVFTAGAQTSGRAGSIFDGGAVAIQQAPKQTSRFGARLTSPFGVKPSDTSGIPGGSIFGRGSAAAAGRTAAASSIFGTKSAGAETSEQSFSRRKLQRTGLQVEPQGDDQPVVQQQQQREPGRRGRKHQQQQQTQTAAWQPTTEAGRRLLTRGGRLGGRLAADAAVPTEAEADEDDSFAAGGRRTASQRLGRAPASDRTAAPTAASKVGQRGGSIFARLGGRATAAELAGTGRAAVGPEEEGEEAWPDEAAGEEQEGVYYEGGEEDGEYEAGEDDGEEEIYDEGRENEEVDEGAADQQYGDDQEQDFGYDDEEVDEGVEDAGHEEEEDEEVDDGAGGEEEVEAVGEAEEGEQVEEEQEEAEEEEQEEEEPVRRAPAASRLAAPTSALSLVARLRSQPTRPTVAAGQATTASVPASRSALAARTSSTTTTLTTSAKRRPIRVRKHKAGQVVVTGTSAEYGEAVAVLEARLAMEPASRDERGYAVGMCPDMCPEVERYRRAHTGESDSDGHLWRFERTAGKLDHSKVIKEYRKEAADSQVEGQGVLRSPPVLQMTMDYIMGRLLPMFDTDELPTAHERVTWYEYVSNRLRAIRKDLKTQNVSSLAAVKLLSQSVRFHLAASYLLADHRQFDRKLNDDRLQDTFGMLESCYKDLKGQVELRDMEAEMRSYQLLRALGRPTILRQLANVLDHPLVQRAMRVFQSVGEVGVGANQSADRGDCNYVRFFRLAKRLTFLQACAVSRHFDAVRFDALHKMASAYNARRAQRPMPMERIVRQLGFDGLRDAEAFVTMFGQDCSQGVLQLCGEMLTQPDGRDYLPVVQHRWLDNLRQGSDLGVVVNGGQRPPVVRHVPHDSFNGLYVSAREVYADEEEEEQEQEEEIMVEEEEDEQEVAVEEPMQEEEAAVAQTAREAAARRAVIAPQPTGAKGTAAAPTVKRVVEKAPAVIPAPTLSGTKPSVPISAASPLAPATSLRSLFGNTAVPATTASAGTTTIASSVPPFGKFAPPAMTTTSSLPPTATATFATSAATLLSLPAPPTYLQQQQKAAAADKARAEEEAAKRAKQAQIDKERAAAEAARAQVRNAAAAAVADEIISTTVADDVRCCAQDAIADEEKRIRLEQQLRWYRLAKTWTEWRYNVRRRMVLAKLPARLQSMSLEDLQTAPPSTSMEMSRGNVRSLLTEKIQAQVSLAQLSAPLGYDYAVAEGLAAWQAAWISQSPAAAYAVPPLTFALHWLVVTGLGSPATSVDLQQVLGKGCTVALGDDAQRAKVGVTAAPAAQAAVEPVEAVWLAWNAGEHPVASVQQVVQKWLGNTSAVIVLHTHPSLSNEAVAQQLDLVNVPHVVVAVPPADQLDAFMIKSLRHTLELAAEFACRQARPIPTAAAVDAVHLWEDIVVGTCLRQLEWDATERETVLTYNAACTLFDTELSALKPSAPAAAALRDWLASVRLSEAQLPSDAEEDAYLLRRAQGLVDSVGEASRCQELFAAAVSRSAPSSAKADSSRAKAALARLQRTLRPWLLNYQPQQQQQPLPWRQLLEGFVQHVVGHAPASLRRTVCAVDVAELNRRAQVWLRAPTAVENRDGNISDMAADNTFYVDGLSGNAAVTGWDEEETGIVWPAGWEDQSATRKRPPANTSAAVAAKKRANTVADMTVGPAEPLPPERAFALLAQAAAEEQQETQAFEARLKSALQGGDREQTALSQPAGSPDSTGVVPVAEALDTLLAELRRERFAQELSEAALRYAADTW